MSKKTHINNTRMRRKHRIRIRVRMAGERPRLSVFRSAKYIYAQIIDDASGKTLAAASSMKGASKKPKTEHAKEVGKAIAEEAKKLNIKKVVFDRGGYRYHGRVKALADSARENGLEM